VAYALDSIVMTGYVDIQISNNLDFLVGPFSKGVEVVPQKSCHQNEEKLFQISYMI